MVSKLTWILNWWIIRTRRICSEVSDGSVSDGSLFCRWWGTTDKMGTTKSTIGITRSRLRPRICRFIEFETSEELSAVIKAAVARVEAKIETLRCILMKRRTAAVYQRSPGLLSCPICGTNPPGMENIDQIFERIPPLRRSSRKIQCQKAKPRLYVRKNWETAIIKVMLEYE